MLQMFLNRNISNQNVLTHQQIISSYCDEFLYVFDRTLECIGKVSECKLQNVVFFSCVFAVATDSKWFRV
jgi:hypothetical protein